MQLNNQFSVRMSNEIQKKCVPKLTGGRRDKLQNGAFNLALRGPKKRKKRNTPRCVIASHARAIGSKGRWHPIPSLFYKQRGKICFKYSYSMCVFLGISYEILEGKGLNVSFKNLFLKIGIYNLINVLRNVLHRFSFIKI